HAGRGRAAAGGAIAPAEPADAVVSDRNARPARRCVRSRPESECARRAPHARRGQPARRGARPGRRCGRAPDRRSRRTRRARVDLATMGPPSGAPPGQSPQTPTAGGALATLAPSQTPRDEYDLAYGYVLRKDYALAEDAFHSFLSKYPNDRLAGDATYWLGE